ncbi:MAG: thermonuclease family protein [Breznakia sp.]
MKKTSMMLFVALMVSNISMVSVNAQIEPVNFSRCVDGDTAHLVVDGRIEKVRFLAINAPEYTKQQEAYGKQASAYVCDALKNAKSIGLEYETSNLRDKYDRLLAWVFVDEQLLQERLVSEGLAEVKYIYGDYKYTNRLYEKEAQAKKQQLNMWSDESYEDTKYGYITILGICFVGVFFFAKKGRKSKLRKLHREMKKQIKK